MTDTWVQGDTEPAMTATLTRSGDPIPLAAVQGIRFQMRKSGDNRYTVNAPAEVVDADLGQVRYRWGSSDLNVPGDYLAQWEITYASGRVETTDPPNEIIVRRQ